MTDKHKPKNKAPDKAAALLSALPHLLLSWYDTAARTLPWRENTEPYRVWVSEIMLQQTGVEFVIRYYKRFLEAFPTIEALAAANEQQVLKLWEGLGYYSRARNLKKAAEIVVRDLGGHFPDTYNDIKKLPGIGAYTAGAIASICFEEPTPAVDGNVERVIARIAGLYTADRKVLKQFVTAMLLDIYPEQRRGDFTQSLMELGALVCVPNSAAKCAVCPVLEHCTAYQSGTVASLPVRQEKPTKKHMQLTVLLLTCEDAFAIRQRDKGGLLSGLWEFPNTVGHLSEAQALKLAAGWDTLPDAVIATTRKKHIFTHIEWEMLCYTIKCAAQPARFIWADRPTLSSRYPLPTAFRKLLKA